MDLVLEAAVVFYSAIAVMLVALTYTYARTYFSTRAKYPLGLLIFALLLLAHGVGTAAGYVYFNNYIGDEAYPFMFGMAGIELVGVAALVKITV